MNEQIRILLIDDHTLFRESLARLLEREQGFRVVASAGTLAEGRSVLASQPIDIVLLDYDLGSEVGTELLAGAEMASSGVRTILVTAGMRPGATLHALAAGASGIVLKHSDPGLLVDAIRSVAGGKGWLDPNAGAAMVQMRSAHESESKRTRSLTARQRQVLRGILDGLANKEIAVRLQASESAVKATIQELFSKAGVRTRSQLVRVAIERYSLEWLQEHEAQA